jgi:hypothetical protein
VTVDRRHYRAAVIGAGFAGIAVGAAFGRSGIDYIVFERGDDVGGTWRDNVYPGCKCDVPSHLYSLSAAPMPDWTHTYSSQPEILAYLRRCADSLGVRSRTLVRHDVGEARWYPGLSRWQLATSAGSYSADVLISANGPLAEPAMPDIPGIADFAGLLFHSARWDTAAELAGQRVGVIGTGASAIQIVPSIQRQVRLPATPPVLPHATGRSDRGARYTGVPPPSEPSALRCTGSELPCPAWQGPERGDPRATHHWGRRRPGAAPATHSGLRRLRRAVVQPHTRRSARPMSTLSSRSRG